MTNKIQATITANARPFVAATDKAAKGTEKLAKSATKAKKPIENTAVASKKTANAFGKLGGAAGALGGQFGHLGGAASGLTSGLGGVAAGVAGVAISAGLAGSSIAKAGDAFKLTEARIAALTGSAEAAKKTMTGIYEIAIRDGVAIETLNSVTSRFTLALSELGKSQADVLNLTEAVSKLGAIGGASSTEFNAAAIQLAQGLASGTVQGEELRSVLEQLPLVAQAIADELGVGIGQLRTMASEGKVTGDVVFEALTSRLGTIRSDFDSLPVTMQRGWSSFTSSLDLQLVKMDKMLNVSGRIAEAFANWGKLLAPSNSVSATAGRIQELQSSLDRFQGLNTTGGGGRTGGVEKQIKALQAELASLRAGSHIDASQQLQALNKRIYDLQNPKATPKRGRGSAGARVKNSSEAGLLRQLIEEKKQLEKVVYEFRAAVSIANNPQQDLLSEIKNTAISRNKRMADLLSHMPKLESERQDFLVKETAKNAQILDKFHSDIYNKNQSLLGQYDQQRDAVKLWAAQAKTSLQEIGKLSPANIGRIDNFTNQKLANIAAEESAKRQEAIKKEFADRAALRAADLANATDWQSGLIRAQNSIFAAANDNASKMESLYTKAFEGITDALTNLVMTGKADFKSLADSILRDLVRIQIQQSITKPLSGLLGQAASALGSALFGAPAASTAAVSPNPSQYATHHTGGIVGSSDALKRLFDSGIFNNAPKYHTGGVAGLKPNEVPAVLERGEGIFTKAQMAALQPANNNQPANVVVNIHNAPAGTTVQQNQMADGGLQIDVLIEEIEGAIGQNIARGEGIAQNLEGSYGLRRLGQ